MELIKYDLQFAVRRLPGWLQKIIKLPEYAGKIYLAGGFIRAVVASETASDLDFFVHADLNLDGLVAKIIEARMPQKIGKYESDNAVTLRTRPLPIQIIKRWRYTRPDQLLEGFDFTVCSAAIWFDGSTWQSACHDRFYPDLAAKRLQYLNPQREEAPGGSMLRVLKYYQRGYRIPLDSLAGIIGRLASAVDLDKLPNTGDGKVADISKVILGLLREVDPLVDPNHIGHLASIPETEELEQEDL